MKRLLLTLAISLGLLSSMSAQEPKHTFAIGETSFLIDGKPIQFFSGEIHPSRIPRECWQDRLHTVRAMGINAISIYIFWNIHEPHQGQYNFKDNADIAEFIRLAQKEGLWVMLRPSPYVCAEWEFGGYPWWLQKIPGMKVRSTEPNFIKAYRNYVKEVGKQLAPLQIQNGGPIIMVQIENEYGFYGSDKDYLQLNKEIFREAGFTCELFTCDPPYTIDNGHLPGTYAAVNGLMKPEEIKKVQERINGKAPFLVSEWYPAWFDAWGKKHNTSPVEKFTSHLDNIFSNGISLNMYMVHGGSNFGFMNGANYDDNLPYQPQTQSYDYDAPINEAGNPTPKFYAYRELALKYQPKGTILPEIPAVKKTIELPSFELNEVATLDKNLPKAVKNQNPMTFEDLDQGYGYVLYTSTLPKGKGWLKLKELRDYAVVLVNGKRIGILDRRKALDSIQVNVEKDNSKLEILVENLGRINFGKYLSDNKKGITKEVTFGGKKVLNWSMYGFPFEQIDGLKFKTVKVNSVFEAPVLRRGTFTLNETGDTYLDMGIWGKGSVWINGHHIGRYWQVGPQQTLYVPSFWLKKGKNEVLVFEQIKTVQNKLRGLNKPILDDVREELFTGPTLGQQPTED